NAALFHPRSVCFYRVITHSQKGLVMKKYILKSKRSRQFGQGMTEYIIIVALVAVAGIGTYRLFGTTVRNQMASLAQEVGGAQANNARQAAATSANAAATAAATNKNMGNYDTNNRQ